MAVIAAGLALALAGCGAGDDGSSTSTSAAAEAAAGPRNIARGGADRTGLIGRSGTARATACELIRLPAVNRIVARITAEPPRPLERTANDSRDLSLCEYRERSGPETYVRVGLDTATRAVRRYFNLITEARQLPSVFPGGPGALELVRGVGDDGTYGGAGAFWIAERLDLTALHDQRIIRTHVYVKGGRAPAEKRAAVELTRRAFANYGRAAREGKS